MLTMKEFKLLYSTSGTEKWYNNFEKMFVNIWYTKYMYTL